MLVPFRPAPPKSAMAVARPAMRHGGTDAEQSAMINPGGQDREDRCESGRQDEGPREPLAVDSHFEPLLVISDRRTPWNFGAGR